MDFDIGTIFYIIITIVAIVAGARGKKKKSGAKPSGTSGAESKVEGFLSKLGVQLDGLVGDTKESVNNFTEEFIPEQSTTKSVFEPVEEAYNHYIKGEVAENRAISEFEGEYDPNSIDNLELILIEARRSTSDSEIQDVIDLDDISNSDYSELIKDFDLQTAVIYSTILNKVEY